MNNNIPRPRRYITGFDGIRSLAVIGVIFYHIMPSSMKGGYLGVPVLFVLSGYLLTDHLRQEWQKTKKISVKQFYIRRFKRLYPSIVALLIITSAYITLFQRNLLNNLRGIVASSLFYVNNWWQINNGLSYFEKFGNESPFTHLWSISVEGQNYLIWPILFGFLMYFIPRKEKVFYIILGLATISALLMGILYTPGEDPTRVYYGTDTRIFSLWIGSALALAWPSTHLREDIPRKARKILNIIGLTALSILVVAFIYLDARYTFVYYGGMYLLSFVAAILIAVTVHPGASLNKWLTNPLFRYLGKRSYAIYLYQFPVLIFYEAAVGNIANNTWLHTIIEIILILTVSELSYRYIEKPMRYFDYKQLPKKLKYYFSKPWISKEKILFLSCLTVFTIACVGVLTAPKNVVDAERQQFKDELTKNQKVAEDLKKGADKDTTSSIEIREEVNTVNPEEVMQTYDLSKDKYQAAQDMEITFIGDSVMLGAIENIHDVFAKAIVDADVGRQLYAGAKYAQDLEDKGMLTDHVVVGLGTNGPATATQFAQMMEVIGSKRQVYLVNVHVPTQRWQNEVNQLLMQMAQQYDNVTLVDWYKDSVVHADWFISDSVHPNTTGRVAYTKLITNSIL